MHRKTLKRIIRISNQLKDLRKENIHQLSVQDELDITIEDVDLVIKQEEEDQFWSEYYDSHELEGTETDYGAMINEDDAKMKNAFSDDCDNWEEDKAIRYTIT